MIKYKFESPIERIRISQKSYKPKLVRLISVHDMSISIN